MVDFRDFVAGSPVRESDFFFRESFVEDVWGSLRKEHVLILAPRRMGKTSVMLRLQDEPRDDRLVVFLNVEEISTPAEFCQNLISAIHEQHPEYLRQTLATTWGFLTGILQEVEEIELFEFKLALLLTQELFRDWRRHQETLRPEHVDSVFHRVLLGETARDKLQHFRSRIRTHYPDAEKDAAFELLDRLSRSDQPLSREALSTAYKEIESTKPQPRTGQLLKQAFLDLMLLLHNDFYVEETSDRQYDFASRTLKLWWRKYYG